MKHVRMVRGALGLENATREDIRLIAVTFGVAVSLIQTYYAPKFNPFTPGHKASAVACTEAKGGGCIDAESIFPPMVESHRGFEGRSVSSIHHIC